MNIVKTQTIKKPYFSRTKTKNSIPRIERLLILIYDM